MNSKLLYSLFIVILFSMFSCVDSSMYNTSLGQNSTVRYQNKTEETKTSAYTHIDLAPDKKNTQTNTEIIENKEIKPFTIATSEKKDTIIEEKIDLIKKPINPAQKDSLIFALIKDKQKTQAQKDSIMEAFINSHTEKIIKYDTIVKTELIKDTVYNTPQAHTEEEILKLKIDSLAQQLNKLTNAETKKEEREAKSDIKKTIFELRTMGKEDAIAHHDWLPPFLIPFGSFIGLLLFGAVPIIGGVLALLALLTGLGTGLYFIFGTPKVNWNNIQNPYKNEPEYRKSYLKETKRRNGLLALPGFIPLAFIALLLIFIISFFLLLF